MPLSMQPKLLRVLQEKEVDPIGSDSSVPVDVRIIAATNQDLRQLVKCGRFREDLFYRLNVFPIRVPPLRERLEDLELLIETHVKSLNIALGKSITKVDDEVYRRFKHYDWPGNIRELHNRLERAMNYVSDDVDTLRIEHFEGMADGVKIEMEEIGGLDDPIKAVREEAERKFITEVLARFNNNKSKAAEYLKIPRPSLYQRMKRLGIEK